MFPGDFENAERFCQLCMLWPIAFGFYPMMGVVAYGLVRSRR